MDKFLPYILAALFLLITLTINIIFVPYPFDNDLDEIGWLADNLTFSRLESFSNVNYPLGLPVLLRFLTPITGNLLKTALAIEAFACSILILVLYKLSLLICGSSRNAFFTAILASLLIMRSATSEFADGISTTCLFASIYTLISKNHWRFAYFIAGCLIGLAFVFRYHYLIFIIIIPLAALVLTDTILNRARFIIKFLSGFFVGASPVIIINILVRGNPFYTGISLYIIGQDIMQSVDWENYLETYALWPVWKLLLEQPLSVIKHILFLLRDLISMPIILASAILIPISLSVLNDDRKLRFMLFFLICTVGYLITTIIPMKITYRAMLPAEVFLALMIMPAIYFGPKEIEKWSKFARILCLFLSIIVISNMPANFRYFKYKIESMKYNKIIIEKLESAGMKTSSEVFSNEMNMYPLNDPKFITFYNYGGYLLLDSKYAKERPVPDARTLEDWRDFMLRKKLRFLVIKKTDKTSMFFDDNLLPGDWELVYWDGKFKILKLLVK